MENKKYIDEYDEDWDKPKTNCNKCNNITDEHKKLRDLLTKQMQKFVSSAYEFSYKTSQLPQLIDEMNYNLQQTPNPNSSLEELDRKIEYLEQMTNELKRFNSSAQHLFLS